MAGPHPLNQAVIAQVLHDLRNGQLRRAKSMGFEDDDLRILKDPAMVSLLANALVNWCSVMVNRDVLRHLLRQVEEDSKQLRDVDRLLRLGASTELIGRFFGYTHQETAVRRDVLGLPKRRGRHPVLTEGQDTDLWRRWSQQLKQRNIDRNDETAMLSLAADLAEATELPLSVIWSAIRGWLAEGLS
ncbi:MULTISPECIES: DUF2857 domain-containing protein [Pseudomonas]|uniref:DUF2857 domain-containing protein n=1 Tax=Pseudomonas TaxID=286 RepID=UPI0023611028|nr:MULTISPECIES: DUF2857 domain-containing protein [Pseudomonas]WJV25671.1 DUF2857 domain-containing protein [Pseudomonas chlororaphis]